MWHWHGCKGMVWKSLEVLNYSELKQLLATLAESPAGVALAKSLQPLNCWEATQSLALTDECVGLIDSGVRIHFNQLSEYTAIFERLSIDGLLLDTQEILQIAQLASCAHSAKEVLRPKTVPGSQVELLIHSIPDLQELLRAIQDKIASSGEVHDDASPVLKRIRNEIGIVRNRLYETLERLLDTPPFSRSSQDDVITIRNERFVLPVRMENRKELRGVVHGTSSSGATVFLEPIQTLELNNRLVRLKERAEEEIRRILQELSHGLRAKLPEIQRALQVLGQLDFGFAKARFAKQFKCTIPKLNQEGTLTLVEGRHPILEQALNSQKQNIVPITVDLNSANRILVVSGPNTGGKTVVLKTVGLLTLMGLSGVPVPAISANIPNFDRVFADIGDRQSLSENLSTFSSHLINIRSILEELSPRSLVLLDELGTGTDPAEGSALGISIVERLKTVGSLAIVTTHHSGLKMYASNTPEVSNACVEFDEVSLRPTFRLIHGVPGSSSGIDIAQRLGLEKGIIDNARQLVSSEDRQIVHYSNDLKKQIAENSRLRQDLEYRIRGLETQKTLFEAESKRRLDEQARQFEVMRQNAFANFEKESRKLLAEIGDKYTAVRAKREIERKGSKLREDTHREASQQLSGSFGVNSTEPVENTAAHIGVGSRVFVKRLGREGTVVSTQGNATWEVVVGNLKCMARLGEIELRNGSSDLREQPLETKSKVTLQMSNPELNSNEINLLGCTVDEAIDRVDKFLDSAYLASMSQIRLIHGHGRGVLRKALGEWLSQQAYVDKFHLADSSEGGRGVTLVALKSR